MKRNRFNVTAKRRTKTRAGKSRYLQKKDSGEQMYGPGCCAHKLVITPAMRDAMALRCMERDREIIERRAISSRINFSGIGL